MERPSILWIDDDKVLVELGSEYLEKKGFSVKGCLDGESGISEALNYHYDIILLDIMLPTINGLHILRVLQKCTTIPVILLTASGDKCSELEGLESGALDYINKPCDLDILIARINRTIKAINSIKTQRVSILKFSNLTLDPLKRKAYLAENLLELTNSEFQILRELMLFPEQGVSKKDLLKSALAREWTKEDKNLDTHIKNLRKKLSHNKTKAEFRIKTLYGYGYLLEKND
jgi:DNA-binding response OmpR family regulator